METSLFKRLIQIFRLSSELNKIKSVFSILGWLLYHQIFTILKSLKKLKTPENKTSFKSG